MKEKETKFTSMGIGISNVEILKQDGSVRPV